MSNFVWKDIGFFVIWLGAEIETEQQNFFKELRELDDKIVEITQRWFMVSVFVDGE